jgi:hypothetical protein
MEYPTDPDAVRAYVQAAEHADGWLTGFATS